MKSVEHLKTSRKVFLIKMFPKSMESHPIQFRFGSEIKRSISELWKTIVPAKNENFTESNFENLTMLCFDGSCQNRAKAFQQMVT